MPDHDTPSGRADKRARIIASQALREAAAPPITRRGGRKRNSGPIWTTPAPIVIAPAAEDEPREVTAPVTGHPHQSPA